VELTVGIVVPLAATTYIVQPAGREFRRAAGGRGRAAGHDPL